MASQNTAEVLDDVIRPNHQQRTIHHAITDQVGNLGVLVLRQQRRAGRSVPGYVVECDVIGRPEQLELLDPIEVACRTFLSPMYGAVMLSPIAPTVIDKSVLSSRGSSVKRRSPMVHARRFRCRGITEMSPMNSERGRVSAPRIHRARAF
jgi:hypothetical protein